VALFNIPGGVDSALFNIAGSHDAAQLGIITLRCTEQSQHSYRVLENIFNTQLENTLRFRLGVMIEEKIRGLKTRATVSLKRQSHEIFDLHFFSLIDGP
jgi:hypothetical protein